jgi:hypothetical protein
LHLQGSILAIPYRRDRANKNRVSRQKIHQQNQRAEPDRNTPEQTPEGARETGNAAAFEHDLFEARLSAAVGKADRDVAKLSDLRRQPRDFAEIDA